MPQRAREGFVGGGLGVAVQGKDVGETSNFMVIGNYYQSLVGNKVCTFVHGWDIKGNEVDLNLGSNAKVTTHGGVSAVNNHVLGELVYYTSADATGDADYVLKHADNEALPAGKEKVVRDVFTNLENTGNDDPVSDNKASFEIKASNLLIPLVENHGNSYVYGNAVQNDQTDGNGQAKHADTYANTPFKQYYYDKDVKFIYVNYVKSEDEIDSVEFKSGVQNVSQAELCQAIQFWPSQAAVDKDLVKAVVIKRESSDASLDRMLYVTKNLGWKEVDKDTNESFYEIEALMYIDGKFVPEQTIIVNKNLQIGDFATYNKVAGTKYEDNYYRVKEFTRFNANPAVLSTTKVSDVVSTTDDNWVKHLMRLGTTLGETTSVDGITLYPDDKNDGVIQSNITNQSFVLGGYRGNSGTVPASIDSAAGIVNTARAYWYNATKISKYDDIDSFEDLWNCVKDSAGKVDLDILLNENPGNDAFRTAYLIVIHSIDDSTGSGTPSIGEGEIDLKATNVPGAKITNIVPASRGSELALTIDIPTQGFIATGATTSVDLIATIDGVEDTFTASDLEVGTNRFVTTTLRLNGDEKISIRPANPDTDMVWSAVNVKYFNGTSDTANEIPATHMGTGTTTVATTAGVAATNFKFSLIAARGYSGAGASWAVENAADGVSTGRSTGATFYNTTAVAAGSATGETIAADGTDFVNVVFSGVTKTDPKFSIAKSASFAADHAAIAGAVAQTGATAADVDDFGVTGGGNQLKVEWDKAATVAAGSTVTFTATVSAGNPNANDFASYTVELDTNYGKITTTKAIIGDPGKAEVVIDADKGDLVINNVTAKGVDPLLDEDKIETSLSDDKLTLTITMNTGVVKTGPAAVTTAEITMTTAQPSSNTIISVGHTAGDEVITVKFSEPVENGAKVTLGTGILNAVLTTDALTSIALTYNSTSGEFELP